MEQRPHSNPKPSSSADSFFGMALAQAFMGIAYGPGADMAWEAAEVTDAVYMDRSPANKNGPNFKLGVQNSLGGIFKSNAQQSPAEIEHAFFRPVQPAMALRPH